ncbi:MAG: ATP-binding protein [candidate division Zixibacteria bacterium]|nr:ATP-binding protein [candidate division Zixibacteria bacterium]
MRSSTQVTPHVTLPRDVSLSTADDLRRQLRRVLDRHPATVVIDCAELERVVSAHVGLLWESHQICAEAGIAISLLNPGAGLVRILDALDLREVFGVDIKPDSAETVISADITELHPRRYADRFAADRGSIDEAISRFQNFLAEASLPELVRFELRTVFYEVATNIRTHGGVAAPDTIAFQSRMDGTRISLTFVDAGQPFNPIEKPIVFDGARAVKTGQTHGFGIALIRKLMDEINYRRRYDSVNVLTLEKKWSQNRG